MKKWLSLIVMSSVLLGAAYFATATESARKMSRIEAARTALAEIDAMLIQDVSNDELLAKRAAVVAELAELGEAAPAFSNGADEGKLRALAEDRARTESEGLYLGMLLERLNEGSILSDREKFELVQSGMIKGEDEHAYQSVMPEFEAYANAYLDALEQRFYDGDDMTEREKLDLYDSGRLESPREPGERLDGVGGPDCFGYRWVDNQNGDTATFDFIDIVGMPGTVELTNLARADDAAQAVNLSFSFPFYGVNRTTVYPSTNGAIGMTSVTSFSNTCTLPTTTFPQGGIWPLWDDQHTNYGGTGVSGTVSDSGAVFYNDNGTRCIIQWDSVGRLSPQFQHTYTYQAILYADGKIKLQWRALDRYAPSTTYPSATVGIQQGSTAPNNNYLTYVCNTSADQTQEALTGRAVWFYLGAVNADDFTCNAVVAPASPNRIYVNTPFNVIGRFRNVGSTTQASDVGYIFNNGSPVTGVTTSLAPCVTGDVDFAGTEMGPGSAGSYELKVYSNLAADVDRSNDTSRVTLTAVNCYDEQHSNAFADTFTTCGAINDFANTCLGSADASEDYIIEWTTTSPGNWNIELIGTTTTTRGLLVSTACPPDSFNCVTFLNQSQDTLKINCLALPASTYYIMVDRSTGCDEVRLNVSPCYANDFRCEAVVQPSPLRVTIGSSFNVVGRFRNIGLVTEAADVRYRFNGGAVISGNTGAIAPQATADVDFAGTETAPATPGDYELLIWSDLGTDGNRANDTCRVLVLARDCWDETQADAFVDAGTTCGAGNEHFNTCLGTADASEDYVYRWTTSTNGAWTIQLIASTTTTRGLLVSTSCPPDSFNCVAFANISQDTVTLSCVPLAAGTYYIMVDRSSGCDAYTLITSPCTAIGRCCYDGGNSCANNGAYDCSVLGGVWDGTTTCEATPCPLFIDGGNTCAEAPLLPVPATVRGNTVGAGDNDPGVQCALGSADPYEGSNTAPDEWYRIVGTGNQITVSLCSGYTAYDTQILVVCSEDCQNFTCVAGNDDATCTFSGLRSTATFCSELGRTYYVVPDGWGSGSGNFELLITEGAACGNYVDCAPEGRCCYLLNGVAACTDNMAAECSALGGQWNDAASCATSPCPVGRCCYLDNGIGACATNTQLECNALSGQWTSTTTCEAAPCPVGRCCYDNGDACANLMQIECTALGGLWDAGLTCEANPCPQILQGSDACAGAVLVPALGQTYVGTNVGYTAETGLPACATWYATTALGVWYNIIGTGNTMTVGLCDALTTYDSEIGVFCGETCGDLLCVASDDDGCTTPALASQLSFCSVANAEYKLLITAFGSGTGTFAFTVSDDGTPCQPTVACPVTVVPCLPVTDLRAYVVSAGNAPNFIQLHFTAPQDANYKIWYSTNPNNDGNPDDGLDPQFILDDTVPALNGASVVVDGAAGFDGYRYYVVTADCSGN